MKKKIALPENFETMSAEDKLKFFENFEYDDLTDENTRIKASFDKASSELSAFKKQLREKMSEEERVKAEREEQAKSIQDELDSLRREKRINGYAKNLMMAGYDTETAQKMAETLPEGIGDEFFQSQKAFLESKSAQFKQEALNLQPDLSKGKPLDPEKQREAEEQAKLRRYAGL